MAFKLKLESLVNLTDFIQKLIKKNKIFEAIPFIYEFKLVDKFPPVPLLRTHSDYAEQTYKKICEKGNNSMNALVSIMFSCSGILLE